MGQNVSVDKETIDFKDLLILGQASPQRPGCFGGPHPPEASSGSTMDPAVSKLAAVSGRHHMKAWKFEMTPSGGRGANATVCERPMRLCDPQHRFCAELQETCSYLILHVEVGAASDKEHCVSSSQGKAERDLAVYDALGAPRCLEHLAARASEACTPRGLSLEVASRVDGPGLRYSIYVWHGVSADVLLKARVFSKAFELENSLRSGLLRQSAFLDGLDRVVTLKTSGQLREADASGGRRPSCSVRGSGNRLLCSLLGEKPTDIHSQRGLAPTGTALRFPLLGQSVSRSLKATSAKAVAKLQPGDGPSGGLNLSVPPRQVPTPKVAIPRLKLGLIATQQQAPAESSPMDVDTISSSRGGQSSASESGGRKRSLDVNAGPASRQSATGHASTSNTTLPKSARTESSTQPTPAGENLRPLPLNTAVVPALRMDVASNVVRSPIANRSDGPTMLNLEEINMSEEALISTYDPDNEENNLHLPNELCKKLQLKQYRPVASEIIDKSLYLGSYQVACDLELLRRHQITHIVNTAGDVCESHFPDTFTYLTYFLKDTNNEDIQLLFYRTLDFIHSATSQGGRVLVHCREGVSRSSTMILAYLMWRFRIPFEAAHERARKIRPICNPNTGFTCQLLLLGKKLGITGNANPVSDKPLLFRVAPHDPRAPYLLLCPTEITSLPLFDPRFGWVVQCGNQLVLWLGSQVPDREATRVAVEQHVRWLETFERRCCSLLVCHEGAEPPELWHALDITVPAEDAKLAASRPSYDEDFETLKSVAATAARLAVAPSLGSKPDACS
eukprot:TRINITY_DN75964_c0_g1_i1.p1 TRINITY_DN75964_c0_g1~~TRINITY_DN75964_c0_g1_i1.p1  ORF type:complete len:791 (+),score=110.12 TRINITY_DN75964_c0_g1_i1:145-2517(+)